MTHLDVELKRLKKDILEMFAMVCSQLEKSREALVNHDQDMAREVRINEKRVNLFELKLDRDCENIIALFNPVAVDLRFVLAALKINSNLERIGDIAEGIAQFVLDIKTPVEKKLLDSTRVIEMFDISISIVQDVMSSLEKEDTKIARTIFLKDEMLDEINLAANTTVAEFICGNSDKVNQSLYMMSIIRKLERVGDQSKNIAEEIIFYIEAKVLKHQKAHNKESSSEREDT